MGAFSWGQVNKSLETAPFPVFSIIDDSASGRGSAGTGFEIKPPFFDGLLLAQKQRTVYLEGSGRRRECHPQAESIGEVANEESD